MVQDQKSNPGNIKDCSTSLRVDFIKCALEHQQARIFQKKITIQMHKPTEKGIPCVLTVALG